MYRTVLVLFTVTVTFGNALIAYDCRGSSANITVISIQDVGTCPSPSNGYKEESRRVQIVQKQEISKTKVETCLIEVTRLIQKCGMFSHVSAVASGLRTYVKSVGPDECRNIHRYKSYQNSGYTIDKIQGNATTTATVTLAGTISMDGTCTGVTYVEDGLTWEKVVVSATLKIKLRDYWANVKLDANEIVLLGGVVCPYTTGYCMDSEIGETIWDRGIQDECSRGDYRIVYEGIGNFITTNKTDLSSDSKYVVVEQEDRVFALTLIGKSHVCFQDAWITEHPKLMVIEGKEYGFPFRKNISNTNNIDLLMYVNTKFMYIEQAYKRTLHRVYINMVHRRCLLHRETLKNRLLIAPLSTNAVSILLKNNPGYIGRVLGEAIYIMQCITRVVEIRRTTNCFNELPVQVDNETLYMAPITRVLQEHGEQIECSHVTPPLYKLDNQWIGYSPLPQVRSEPEILQPAGEPILNFQPIRRLSAGGLYTNQDIREAQQSLIFGVERQAVSTLITRKITGLKTASQGYSTIKLFDDGEIKQLAHNTIKQLWGWFTDLGILTSGLFGINVVFRITKYLIVTVLNALSLYHTFGWSCNLLASLWNTLAIWILHRETRRTTQENIATENANVPEVNSMSENVNGIQPSEVVQEDNSPYKHIVIKLKDVPNS